MTELDVFRKHGLFDKRVPRYTSYPPANRFEAGAGRRLQRGWLSMIDGQTPLSIYVHIPFCRRLCWFCACRTQGTATRAPIDGYLDSLFREIETVSDQIRGRPRMARLHLGGGTPTLLSPAQMSRLMNALEGGFDRTSDFEFSVEVDPTEADPDIIDELGRWAITRASIGVQDFDPEIQKAIGRAQTVAETQAVVAQLRRIGAKSVNVDLLYGLPYQSIESLGATLAEVLSFEPDRIALYGYAHVPHISKRQNLIDATNLPHGEERFRLARFAEGILKEAQYQSLGLDHFAKQNDSLARAARNGRMRRNFQGYTDDPCTHSIGLGASAISVLPQGYIQNATATGAYQARIAEDGLAGHKGHALTPQDRLAARAIEMLMCSFEIDGTALRRGFVGRDAAVDSLMHGLSDRFPTVVQALRDRVWIKPGFEPLVRVIAGTIDPSTFGRDQYSLAI